MEYFKAQIKTSPEIIQNYAIKFGFEKENQFSLNSRPSNNTYNTNKQIHSKEYTNGDEDYRYNLGPDHISDEKI